MRQTLIGVNFIDCYHRSGLYPAQMPLVPGLEAIGVVERTGPDVKDFKPGDRVCYANGPIGAYADTRIMPVNNLVKVPDSIIDEKVGGSLLRGITAWYLTHSLRKITAGETILFHAAAGGVGLLFCQWASAMGATVIGTVSTSEKAEIAKKNGCEHVIVYEEEDFVSSVMEVTKGEGVSVVYDGVGKNTFFKSLDCLAKRGLLVSFGNASGPPPELDIGRLGPQGSLFVTRPTLADYTATRIELVQAMTDLFSVIESGDVVIEPMQSYSLENAKHAHLDLENRRTTGSISLVP